MPFLVLQQYWAGDSDAYGFIGVRQLAQAFQESGIGAELDTNDPDLEKGQLHEQHSNAEEEDSRQNGNLPMHSGGKREKLRHDEKKRDDLDPLVHEKCVT